MGFGVQYALRGSVAPPPAKLAAKHRPTRLEFDLTNYCGDEYEQYKKEYQQSLIHDIYEKYSSFLTPSAISKRLGERVYCLIRSLKPDVVVETGVANGGSTLCMLSALNKNGTGHLYSVDMPSYAEEDLKEILDNDIPQNNLTGGSIPADKSPGWIIPEQYRDQWTLYEGRTYERLPNVLDVHDKIDMFFHDADHSYAGMMFDYTLAWQHLRADGFLLSDDIQYNPAFFDFTRAYEIPLEILGRNKNHTIGICRRPV